MVRRAETYQSNQWGSAHFSQRIDLDVETEARLVAAYDRPIDLGHIRAQVIGAVLSYAIPAGNA